MVKQEFYENGFKEAEILKTQNLDETSFIKGSGYYRKEINSPFSTQITGFQHFYSHNLIVEGGIDITNLRVSATSSTFDDDLDEWIANPNEDDWIESRAITIFDFTSLKDKSWEVVEMYFYPARITKYATGNPQLAAHVYKGTESEYPFTPELVNPFDGWGDLSGNPSVFEPVPLEDFLDELGSTASFGQSWQWITSGNPDPKWILNLRDESWIQPGYVGLVWGFLIDYPQGVHPVLLENTVLGTGDDIDLWNPTIVLDVEGSIIEVEAEFSLNLNASLETHRARDLIHQAKLEKTYRR